MPPKVKKLSAFSATIEFIETREDKLRGRNAFFARLLSDTASNQRDDPVIKE